jgi:hypothetical protein
MMVLATGGPDAYQIAPDAYRMVPNAYQSVSGGGVKWAAGCGCVSGGGWIDERRAGDRSGHLLTSRSHGAHRGVIYPEE